MNASDVVTLALSLVLTAALAAIVWMWWRED